MRVHQDWQGLDPAARGASVAMGNFDGVHIGHRSVIALAQTQGRLGVITFEPHPREYFAPDAAPVSADERRGAHQPLGQVGVQDLYALPFDARIASMSPDTFARQIPAEGLGVSHVVVGADFCFGKGRSGTSADLQALGSTYGFGVTIAQLIRSGTTEISSTAIRQALTDGRPRDAAAMLGHWHRIEGEVIHGDQRGRELGYPTANMSVAGLHLPRFGVYAVKVDVRRRICRFLRWGGLYWRATHVW